MPFRLTGVRDVVLPYPPEVHRGRIAFAFEFPSYRNSNIHRRQVIEQLTKGLTGAVLDSKRIQIDGGRCVPTDAGFLFVGTYRAEPSKDATQAGPMLPK